MNCKLSKTKLCSSGTGIESANKELRDVLRKMELSPGEKFIQEQRNRFISKLGNK